MLYYALKSAQILNSSKCYTAPHTLFGHFPLSYILSFENACDQNVETIL